MLLREVVHEIVESPPESSRAARWFNIAMPTLIGLNIVALVLETVDPIAAVAGRWLAWFEGFSVTVFTVEYALRLWSCTAVAAYREPWRGRWRYAPR